MTTISHRLAARCAGMWLGAGLTIALAAGRASGGDAASEPGMTMDWSLMDDIDFDEMSYRQHQRDARLRGAFITALRAREESAGVSAATAGLVSLWPGRPDLWVEPAVTDANAWRRQMLDAPWLRADAVLQNLREVRLEIRQSRELAGLVFDAELPVAIGNALGSANVTVSESAEACVRFTVEMRRESDPGAAGAAIDAVGDVLLVAEARLELPAWVLRQGRVYRVRACVAQGEVALLLAGTPMRRRSETLANGLTSLVNETVNRLMTATRDSARIPPASSAWAAWLASDAEATVAARRREFLAAADAKDGREPLQEFTGAAAVEPAVFGVTAPAGEPLAGFARWDDVRQAWADTFAACRLKSDTGSGLRLVHAARQLEVSAVDATGAPVRPTSPARAATNRVGLVDGECLGVIGGRHVRFAGETWSHRSLWLRSWQPPSVWAGVDTARANFEQQRLDAMGNFLVAVIDAQAALDHLGSPLDAGGFLLQRLGEARLGAALRLGDPVGRIEAIDLLGAKAQQSWNFRCFGRLRRELLAALLERAATVDRLPWDPDGIVRVAELRADVDAIEDALRPLQLTPLPDTLVRRLAVRLTLELHAAPLPAAMRAGWFGHTREGKRAFVFTRVSQDRSAKQWPEADRNALRAALDRVELGDPLLWSVFGDPLAMTRSNRPVEFSRDFLGHFSRWRAQGPGALAGERVVTAADALWEGAGLGSADAALRTAARNVQEAWAGVRMLRCTYVDPDKPAQLRRQRYFFYDDGATVDGQKLAAMLPAELARVFQPGPPVARGPGTLADADKLIARAVSAPTP